LNPLTSLVNTSDVGYFDDSHLAIHCTSIISGIYYKFKQTFESKLMSC